MKKLIVTFIALFYAVSFNAHAETTPTDACLSSFELSTHMWKAASEGHDIVSIIESGDKSSIAYPVAIRIAKELQFNFKDYTSTTAGEFGFYTCMRYIASIELGTSNRRERINF